VEVSDRESVEKPFIKEKAGFFLLSDFELSISIREKKKKKKKHRHRTLQEAEIKREMMTYVGTRILGQVSLLFGEQGGSFVSKPGEARLRTEICLDL
jgi:hypothetical protein